MNNKTEVAIFGAGCFWGVEETFGNLSGVISTEVGYTGGHKENPIYEEVSSDRTGHAEAVKIEYDPKIISYDKLLDIFWANHDPTSLNKQGSDIGSQYRSVIFYFNEKEKKLAEESKNKLIESGKFGERKIVTEISLAKEFYKAEDYHQKYLAKQGLGTCKI